jgi:hypothetical protein
MIRAAAKFVGFAAVLAIAATTSVWAGDAHKTYKGNYPRSDTAILISEDNSNRSFDGSAFVKVDGKSVGNFLLPGVFSVRVLPGTHTFVIQAVWDNTSSITSGGTAKTRFFEFEVKDMKALHVYVARYRKTDDGAELAIQDLGERAEYRSTLAPIPKF